MTSQSSTRNHSDSLASAAAIARSIFERVVPIRVLGAIARYELVEGYSGGDDYGGLDYETVGFIELDDDGRPVLLNRDGRVVQGEDASLPSATEACASKSAMREWYPELI